MHTLSSNTEQRKDIKHALSSNTRCVEVTKREMKFTDLSGEAFLLCNSDKKVLVSLHYTVRFHLECQGQKLSKLQHTKRRDISITNVLGQQKPTSFAVQTKVGSFCSQKN